MTVKVDFDLVEVSASATVAAAPSVGTPTTTTLVTIPLQSAAFPLQSGRAVRIEFEFIGEDSSGNALYYSDMLFIQGGSPPTTPTFSQGPRLIATQSLTGSGGFVGGGNVTINGSGDLVVAWNNYDTGNSHDVAVRIRQRWMGNT